MSAMIAASTLDASQARGQHHALSGEVNTLKAPSLRRAAA